METFKHLHETNRSFAEIVAMRWARNWEASNRENRETSRLRDGLRYVKTGEQRMIRTPGAFPDPDDALLPLV